MRSKRAKKRPIVADPIYKSRVVTRMINVVLQDGKKATASGIVYKVLERLNEDGKEATKMFEQAIKNVMPTKEVRSRRVGGATYQIPYPLKHDRSEALAIKWLVNAAKQKEGTTMVDRLFSELKDAFEGVGSSIKKRDETHKSADSNRAFSHFARF